jgi:hypothetical protein
LRPSFFPSLSVEKQTYFLVATTTTTTKKAKEKKKNQRKICVQIQEANNYKQTKIF